MKNEVSLGSHPLTLSPSLISHTVSVDVIKVSVSELRSCVKREVGAALIPCPILPTSLISRTVSVDVMHRDLVLFLTDTNVF